MPTLIKLGLFDGNPVRSEDNELTNARIYIDHSIIQVHDDEENLVIELSYEELRGIMAILKAEQKRRHIYITAAAKNN